MPLTNNILLRKIINEININHYQHENILSITYLLSEFVFLIMFMGVKRKPCDVIFR